MKWLGSGGVSQDLPTELKAGAVARDTWRRWLSRGAFSGVTAGSSWLRTGSV